jgi:hypothetical protein
MEDRDRLRNQHNRKRLLALLTGMALALGTSGSARAASLVYEPFVYDDGTVLDGVTAAGENLTGTYEPLAISPTPQQTLTVVSPGLGYGSLGGAPSAAGNRASDKFGGVAGWATADVDQDVDTSPGTTVYWSALFTFDDSQDASHLANITLSDADTGDSITFGQSSSGPGLSNWAWTPPPPS